MALTDAIKEAIRNNLPEQTAEELRKYIEETNSLKDNVKYFKDQLHKVTEMSQGYLDDIKELTHKLANYQNIEQREKDLLAKEKQIALTELSEVKEKEKVVLMQGLVNAIFRNKTIMHMQCSSGYDAQYPGGPYNKTNNTTIEEV